MKADNFSRKTAIIVVISRILGVRTLDHSNTRVWLALSFFYKLILMAGLNVYVYYNFPLRVNELASFLAYVMYVFVSFITDACAFIIQILGLLHYKEMSLLRKNMAETDQNLMKLNVAVDHRNVFSWIIVACVSSVCNMFAFIVVYAYQEYLSLFDLNEVISNIHYTFLVGVGGVTLADFAAHVCWLRNNFKRINDLLKMFFVEECQIGTQEWNNKVVSSWLQRCLNEWHVERISGRNKIIPYIGTQIMRRQLYPVNKISMLQRIRHVHLQLCVITKSMNKVFGTQIVCHSTVIMLNFVTILYYTYMQWTNQSGDTNERMDFLPIYVIDALYIWLKVVLACLLCEDTVKEIKKVAQILQVCSIHNSDFELKHELTQFSLQVSLSDWDKKEARIFPLNNLFIIRSIGAVITYFLIMIQWTQTLATSPSSSLNSTVTVRVHNNTLL